MKSGKLFTIYLYFDKKEQKLQAEKMAITFAQNTQVNRVIIAQIER